MKPTRKSVLACLFALILTFHPASALASTPRVHSSQYGLEGSVASWNLFGRTNLISFSGLQMRVQVRCVHQDLEASMFDSINGTLTFIGDPKKVGGCDSGANLFLFQILSGPKDLEVTFSNLVNFTFSEDPVTFTVGIMECDPRTDPNDPNFRPNTAAICTNVTPAEEQQVSAITLAHKGNTEVTFLIPEIPSFNKPACDKTVNVCHEERGLTLFLKTDDLPSGQPVIPIPFPTISVKTDSDLD